MINATRQLRSTPRTKECGTIDLGQALGYGTTLPYSTYLKKDQYQSIQSFIVCFMESL